MTIRLTVNGHEFETDGVSETASLLDLLREHLDLPGSKDACRQGECGSCSVLLKGELVCSCLVAAGQAAGATVVTIEGLAQGGQIDALRESMIAHGAVQCGFCTPGIVVAAYALLQRCPQPSADQVRVALSGNLCRCTGYQAVVDAVVAAGRVELDA